MKRPGLLRRTPLLRRKPIRRARPGPSVPQAVRDALWLRSGGRCDLCGEMLSVRQVWHAHHRLRRSQGGLDELANLLALHPVCHLTIVHGDPARAYEHGWLVRSAQDPGEVSVWRHMCVWSLPEERWADLPQPRPGRVEWSAGDRMLGYPGGVYR